MIRAWEHESTEKRLSSQTCRHEAMFSTSDNATKHLMLSAQESGFGEAGKEGRLGVGIGFPGLVFTGQQGCAVPSSKEMVSTKVGGSECAGYCAARQWFQEGLPRSRSWSALLLRGPPRGSWSWGQGPELSRWECVLRAAGAVGEG